MSNPEFNRELDIQTAQVENEIPSGDLPTTMALLTGIICLSIFGKESYEAMSGVEDFNWQDIVVLFLAVLSFLEAKFRIIPKNIGPVGKLDALVTPPTDEEQE